MKEFVAVTCQKTGKRCCITTSCADYGELCAGQELLKEAQNKVEATKNALPNALTLSTWSPSARMFAECVRKIIEGR